MNVLVDIGHPAHVHLYRHFINEIRRKGAEVTVTVRDIATAKSLLEIFGLDYIELGRKRDTFSGKLADQISYDFQVLKIIRQRRINIGVGSSIVLPHVSAVTHMHSIVLDDDDDEVEPLFRYFAHPFATTLLSPDVLRNKRSRKSTLFYPGYHELAYLHPSVFTPDEDVLGSAGIKPGERYFILRFNAFRAHHDQGAHGLTREQKLRLVERLKPEGRIFITAERDIGSEFEEYRLKVSPEKIHSLISYATILIGDSQTMSSEAAVLGTPSLRMNSFAGRISYLEEEEQKYGLTYAFKPYEFDRLLTRLDELLSFPNLKQEWQHRRSGMLADKINVTAFLVWFVENYPGSIKTMEKESWNFSQFR
jgi:predicted glycosyltransferase